MPKERACANAPALSRRAVLASMSSAGTLLALPAPALSSQDEDPILPLYRKWFAARSAWNSLADFEKDETPEGEAHWDAMFAASDRMQELTPVSPQGIAALIHVLWFLEGPRGRHGTSRFLEEVEQDSNKIMRQIFSAACGGRDLVAVDGICVKGSCCISHTLTCESFSL